MLVYYWLSLYSTSVYNSDKLTPEEIPKETQLNFPFNHKVTVQDLELCVKKLEYVIYALNILKEIRCYLDKNILKVKNDHELILFSQDIANLYKQKFNGICDTLKDNLKYVGSLLLNKNLEVYFDLNLFVAHVDLIMSIINHLPVIKMLFFSLYAKNPQGKHLLVVTDGNLCSEEYELEEIILLLISYLDDCVKEKHIFNILNSVFNGLIVMLG